MDMVHHSKKPVGYFIHENKLIAILPHDKEEAQAAIARVAQDWGVDPAAVTSAPPKPPGNPGEFAGIEVVVDRHMPFKDFKPKPWPGKGAAAAVDGVSKFYDKPAASEPIGSSTTPPSTPALPSPSDYSGILGSKPQ